mmetsp:Transcript_1094/g.2279  ORF Transcript_1094/g.2279 Transcript_1094/m.2279 type:complete len:212 (-) Transcript_1094:136-771(-)
MAVSTIQFTLLEFDIFLSVWLFMSLVTTCLELGRSDSRLEGSEVGFSSYTQPDENAWLAVVDAAPLLPTAPFAAVEASANMPLLKSKSSLSAAHAIMYASLSSTPNLAVGKAPSKNVLTELTMSSMLPLVPFSEMLRRVTLTWGSCSGEDAFFPKREDESLFVLPPPRPPPPPRRFLPPDFPPPRPAADDDDVGPPPPPDPLGAALPLALV